MHLRRTAYKLFTQSITGRDIDNNSSFPETQDKLFVFDYLAKLKLPSPCKGVVPSVFFAVHNHNERSLPLPKCPAAAGEVGEVGMKCEF